MTNPEPVPKPRKAYLVTDVEVARLLAGLPRDDKGMVSYATVCLAWANHLERPGFDRAAFARIVLREDPGLVYPAHLLCWEKHPKKTGCPHPGACPERAKYERMVATPAPQQPAAGQE